VSAIQAEWLFGNLDSLKRLLKVGDLNTFVHRTLSSFQPVWAEILWGRAWSELGVAAYGRPRGSLNEVTALSEQDLPGPCKLLESRQSVVVNLPLLIPRENRFWLSDGSLPLGSVVSPMDLERCPSLKDYKPRPFSSVALGAGRIAQAVADSVQVETVRLKCAGEIMRAVEWDISVVRLTAFDLLFHLLGVEYLHDRELVFHDQVRDFLSTLDAWLQELLDSFPDAVSCLMSTFGHSPCVARVNLNEILYRGGFCEPASERADFDREQRRAMASLLLQKSAHSGVGADESQTLAVTPCWKFNLAGTVCGSPVQGAIFLNLKERYDGGIVESSEAARLLEDVRQYVVVALKTELGIEPDVWQSEHIGSTGPELIIYADGIEFHNSSIAPAVDAINKPRSAHTCEGFVWLPRGISPRSEAVTPLQLHELLALGSGQEVSYGHG